MGADHTVLGLNISDWVAIVNAVTVLILVFVNIYYLKIARDQAEAARAQAKESQRQADVAMENLKLAKAQAEQQAAQELTTTIAILRGLVVDVSFWLPIVKEKGKTAPSTVRLVPDDWPLVVFHAGRVSAEFREKALAVHSMLANANYHITRFLASHEPSLLEPAYANLVNVGDKLHEVIAALENFEKSAPLFIH
ncbi:MAG TPA: hypothetical protein VGM27_24580 [Acidobacteriaceae bacterium]|jgi:hypothetical protein